jgi:hypothetical protein
MKQNEVFNPNFQIPKESYGRVYKTQEEVEQVPSNELFGTWKLIQSNPLERRDTAGAKLIQKELAKRGIRIGQTFEALSSSGTLITDPRYVMHLEWKAGGKSEPLGSHSLHRVGINELAQYLTMRAEICSMTEAEKKLNTESPTLVIKDQHEGKTHTYQTGKNPKEVVAKQPEKAETPEIG